MEEYLYTRTKKDWRYLNPVNNFFTSIDYFIEKNVRSLSNHWKTFAAFSLGLIIYDIMTRIFIILANIFPSQGKLFNFTLSENINNLFLLLDICFIFLLLHFVTSSESEEPRNRHWYE